MIRHAVKVVNVLFMCVVLVVSGAMSGCTAKQWFDIVGALLPIVGQTYLQFYGFASKGGVDPADVALVQTLTSAGQDAISRVEAIVAAVKAGDQSRLGETKVILAQLQQSVNGFLADAQIKNSAHFAAYSGFAQAILADVSDIIALIPVLVPSVGAARGVPMMKVTYSHAKGLPGVFQERLNKLPK